MIFSWLLERVKKYADKKGAYHVFNPKVDAEPQVNNYISTVEDADGFDSSSIAPILDATDLHCNPRKLPLEKRIRECLEGMETCS